MYVAMSIVQEGYGLPLFHNNVYSYFISGKCASAPIADDDVLKELIRQVIL